LEWLQKYFMMNNKHENLLYSRVKSAQKGENKTVIMKMKSGWAVLGDNQIIPGYCLLLADPIVDSLNLLTIERRTQFLSDMTVIGDALMKVLKVEIINYSILGNADKGLHAHIHPRYEWEKDEFKKAPPWKYNFMKEIPVQFDYERDNKLIEKIKKEIERIYFPKK